MFAKSRNGRTWSSRRVAIAIVFALSLLVGYQPLLRGVYALLVAEEVDANQRGERSVLLFGDRGCIERARELLANGQTNGILIVQPKRRAVEIRAAPSLADVATAQLKSDAVSAHPIDVLVAEGRTTHQLILAIDQWSQRGQLEQVLIVCPRYQTRYLKTVIQSVVPQSRINTFQLCPVAPEGFDERRWWMNTTGIKRVGAGLVRLFHAKFFREPVIETRPWSPEQYETWLKQITDQRLHRELDVAVGRGSSRCFLSRS